MSMVVDYNSKVELFVASEEMKAKFLTAQEAGIPFLEVQISGAKHRVVVVDKEIQVKSPRQAKEAEV